MPYEWDDPEGPDAQDRSGDDDSVDLRTCPGCDQHVYEHAEKCPLCGEWLTAARTTVGWWGVALAVLLILALLIMTIR